MILGLAFTSHTLLLPSSNYQAAGAAVSGRYFDNIVIVAMENQNYADVMGDGHGDSAAPYIASLLAQGATVPNYHGAYSGCSEACYIALISGDTYGTSNGDRDIGDPSTRTLVNLFEAAGVSWQAYCEASCGRDGDHFPWIDFVSITTSSERMSHVDTSASTSNLVNAVGSYNFLWFTPEDSNNMHDNDVSSGDSYLSGFIPDILSKPIFTSGRALLLLWWDEYDPAPFLMIGPAVQHGYVSSRNDIEHYTITKLIEENWGMSSLTSNDASQASMGEFFGTSAPPTNPPSNQPPLLPTQVSDLWLILVGVILGGTAGVAIFRVKSRHKNQAKATIQGKDEADAVSQKKSSRKESARRTKSRATRSVSKGRLAVVLFSVTLLMGGAFAASLRTPDPNAAPEQASTDTVKFAVAGDWGLNSNAQTNFGLIGAQGVDFALILGDITYGANPEQWCSDFHNAGISKVILIFGNHDVGESDSDYRERFQAACSPGVTIVDSHLCNLSFCYGELYYFDYPAVGPIMRIIGSNSGLGGNEGDTDYSPGTANFNFVSNAIDDARARGIPWVLTATHKTCWALSGRGCDIGEGYFQMQVQKKADIIFQAHDHLYLRGKQVSCQAIAVGSFDPSCVVDSTTPYSKGFGSVVMNIGTGGEGTYSPDTGDSEAGYFVCPDTCNDGNVGFGLFTVDSTSLSEVYKNIDSAGFTDSFSIGGAPPPPGQLTASFTFSPTSPLVGQTVTFTGSATGTSGYSFSWNFGDGASGTGQIATHAYSAANAYQVTLTVHDSVGGTDTTTQTVTIFNQPPPPAVLSADFTYSPSSPFVGQPITFTGTASGGRAPYNFAWDFGDLSTAAGSSVQHSYPNSGTFMITLTVTDDSANESSTSMSVDVASRPNEVLTSFFFRDPGSNDVSSAITWQVWDGGKLVSTASQAPLDPLKSYELRIFYQGHLIVSQDFNAQPTIQKTIFMYSHHSATDGYIVFNSTITTFIVDEESNSRLRFNAEGSEGPYTVIINVPKGPVAVLKNGSDYPYTYDSGESLVMVETPSLSSWELDFVSSAQPPSICPICPPIPSTVTSNLWLVVVGGMIGLTTSLAVLTHRAHNKLQQARRLYATQAS